MKKKILCLIGFCTGCALIVAGYVWQYSLHIQEFNKQIEVYGYYKEDIHLLNQYGDYHILILYIVLGFVLSAWSLLSYIFSKVDK